MYIKKPSYSSGSSPLRIPSFRSKSRSRRDDSAATPGEAQSVGSGQIYHTSSHDDRRSERRRVSSRSNGDDGSMRRSRSQGRSRHDDDDGDRRERRERRSSRYADDDERRERRDRRHSRSHRDRDRDDDDRRERRRSERGDRSDRHGDRRKSTSSRKQSSRSSRSGGGAAAAAAPAKPKVVLPTDVDYRPGRIQSLTADQERTHKQYWAYFLAYWGYDIGFDPQEVKYSDVFVASTGRADSSGGAGLSRTATHNSIQSANTSTSKKKKGWLGGSGGSTSAAPASQTQENHAPANSPRMQDIQTKSSSEQFIPTDVPSPDVVNAFVNHYKLVSPEYFKEVDDDQGSSDVSDAASMESFVTADTTITNPDDFPTESYSKRGGGGTSNGAMLSAPAASNKPVKSANINADLTVITPVQWQQMFMSACRNDLPDNFLLRFMRARKWNTENALKMLSKSIKWRMEFAADEWVMESDGPSYLTGQNQGFIKNLTTEKSWIKGSDFQKSPIFWFQAKKHFGSDSPSDETQRYAVTTIEWVRLFLREVTESVDTASIVFDLTGFTLKNADYTTIKFLAEVFEAHYPECLGRIYVHNAPWIFSTVWNIIKNWLDPVVASKIVFTKNFKDLSGYIAPEFIPTDLGGIDTSGPIYPIPKPGDDRPPKPKDATYARLMKERDILFMRFIDCTAKWVGATNPDVSAKYLEEKTILNVELSNNWIALQGYIRNPSPYDRIGNLVIKN